MAHPRTTPPCITDRLDRLERVAIALGAAMTTDYRIGPALRDALTPMIQALRAEHPTPPRRQDRIRPAEHTSRCR